MTAVELLVTCRAASVIHDISDPSRGLNRCVYGYWIKD